MRNLTAFIVTLKEHTDPGIQSLATVLLGKGIIPQVVSGVDGRKLEAGQYFRSIQPYRQQSGLWMSPSEVGCALSHKMVLQKIAEHGLGCALVLEDDVILDDLALSRILRLQEDVGLRDTWVSLGGQEGLDVFTSRLRGTPIPHHEETWEIHPLCYGLVHRTVGYLVGHKVAQSYADLMERGVFVIDDFVYARMQGAIARLVVSNCVGHPRVLTQSNIQAERDMVVAARVEKHLPLRLRLKAEIKRTLDARIEERRKEIALTGSEHIQWKSRF